MHESSISKDLVWLEISPIPRDQNAEYRRYQTSILSSYWPIPLISGRPIVITHGGAFSTSPMMPATRFSRDAEEQVRISWLLETIKVSLET